ncbi:MAG TPA: hypothetical protein VIJ33_09075, partial [Solirubrobacteraceae bacterium]
MGQASKMTERDRSRQAPPGSPDAGDPVLSVVLPLEHVYGDVIRFLESWTTQTLARSRYAIIIAAPLGFDRQVLARVRGLLSDNDSLIEVAVENDGDEIPLWAAAAAAARSEWLFVTEAHCLAAPNCLSAVVESIEAAPPELAAITVGHDNAQDTRLRTIGGRWIDAVCGLRTESPWRPVVQFGTAIRSAIFAKLGGFDERAGVFSMALFGARLHEAGFSTGHLDGVFVTHLYEPTLRGAKAITLDFVYGECLKRAHDDAAHFDGYFGYAAEWG